MAEIRSTLDLVLERTKNLSLTEDEKASLQRKELTGRIRGWVKKYLDGLMDLKAVRAEMAALPKSRRKASRDLFKGLVLESLDVQGDTGKIFDLLEGVLEESREPYLAAVRNFQEALDVRRSQYSEALKTGFAGRGISGSAVIPNLACDEAWRLFQEKSLAELRKSLTLIGRDS
jgi:hypothetical protein